VKWQVQFLICVALVGCSSASSARAPASVTSTVVSSDPSSAAPSDAARPVEAWRLAQSGRLRDGRRWEQRIAAGSEDTLCSSFDLGGSATRDTAMNRTLPATFFHDGFLFSCSSADESSPIEVQTFEPQILPPPHGVTERLGFISGVTVRPVTSVRSLGKIRFSETDQQDRAFVWWFHRLPKGVRVTFSGLSAQCRLKSALEAIGPCTIVTGPR